MNAEIEEMKCFVFNIAKKRWNISSQKCVNIFKKCGAFEYIEKCYDILHLSSYECVVDDIEDIIKNRGITI